MMGSVVGAIQALGVEVEFIPPGCTGLVQPVDVGYNKAFKSKDKEKYSNWLFDQDPDLPVPKTSRRDVVEWILAAETNILMETRRKVWLKTRYAYFSD